MERNGDWARPLVTSNDVVGAMAMWAVRQHPRRNPPGLDRITARLLEEASKWEDGIPSLPMRRFDGWAALERWLRAALEHHPVLTLWNSHERGETPDLQFTSRFEGPRHPDNDFIDVDALLRNVSTTVMRDALREHEACGFGVDPGKSALHWAHCSASTGAADSPAVAAEVEQPGPDFSGSPDLPTIDVNVSGRVNICNLAGEQCSFLQLIIGDKSGRRRAELISLRMAEELMLAIHGAMQYPDPLGGHLPPENPGEIPSAAVQASFGGTVPPDPADPATAGGPRGGIEVQTADARPEVDRLRPPVMDIGLMGPVNGCNEPDVLGQYLRLVVVTKGESYRKGLISRGAAEGLMHEIHGALQYPDPLGGHPPPETPGEAPSAAVQGSFGGSVPPDPADPAAAGDPQGRIEVQTVRGLSIYRGGDQLRFYIQPDNNNLKITGIVVGDRLATAVHAAGTWQSVRHAIPAPT